MTRSENMRRLWADPEWAARARARQSETTKATLAKLWADPAYRETRLATLAAGREVRMAKVRAKYIARVSRETSAGEST